MKTERGLWRCSGCGEAKPKQPDTSWRFAGNRWEHRCADAHPQAGHQPARFFGEDCGGMSCGWCNSCRDEGGEP